MPSGNLNGYAPPTYVHDLKTFKFGFWSWVVANVSGGPTSHVNQSRVHSTNFQEGATVEAKAWYVWDLGTGPGAHGAYLDAFDVSAGDFIPDDFVDVSPDERPERRRTQEANNGFLVTDNTVEDLVTARDPTGDTRARYEFQYWEVMADLIFGNPPVGGDPPTVIGRKITLHQLDIIVAVAFYNVPPLPPTPPFQSPREFSYIIGNLADGPYIIFGPFGPRPVGPWDPTTFTRITDVLNRIGEDLGGRDSFIGGGRDSLSERLIAFYRSLVTAWRRFTRGAQ
jgi:hypothetical protein